MRIDIMHDMLRIYVHNVTYNISSLFYARLTKIVKKLIKVPHLQIFRMLNPKNLKLCSKKRLKSNKTYTDFLINPDI